MIYLTTTLVTIVILLLRFNYFVFSEVSLSNKPSKLLISVKNSTASNVLNRLVFSYFKELDQINYFVELAFSFCKSLEGTNKKNRFKFNYFQKVCYKSKVSKLRRMSRN